MKRFWLIFAACCLLLALFLFQPIDLTLEDLGRHIKNGELVFQHPELLKTNFYSYTQQEFPFLNHHWLSGVIFFAVEKVLHIQALVILYGVMVITALLIILRRAYLRGGFIATALTAPFLTLFIGERHTVRPEGFGLLFLTYILLRLDLAEKERKLPVRTIVWLCVLQLLWVNLHISFIFGLFVIGSYMLPELLRAMRSKKITMYFRSLVALLISASVVSVLNPSGIKGTLYPLNIFSNYGYDIVENKSLSFLYPRIYDPGIQLYFCFSALALVLLLIRLFIAKKRNMGEFLRVFVGMVLGFIALRNLPIFAVFTFPFIAESLRLIPDKIKLAPNTQLSIRMLGILLAVVGYLVIFVLVASGTYHPSISVKQVGLGYVQHQLDAAEFFKSLNIQGNMFNNYDIGSYLIYTQYPDHHVFVDNRPEAYSYDFFKQTYIPMQENDVDWNAALEKYQFQSIFFGHRDLTPWAQIFLQKRLTDPNWKVVYIDAQAIIFVRDIPEHAGIIADHPVSPQDMMKYLSIPR